MRIVCEFENSPPRMRGLMGDLKTIKGYLDRLKNMKGLEEFVNTPHG